MRIYRDPFAVMTAIIVRSMAVAAMFLALVEPACAQVPVSWLQAVNGNWSDGIRWSGGVVPNNGGGTEYDVTLNVAGSDYVVTIFNDITINDLTLTEDNAKIRHESGTFTADLIDLFHGRYELRGGTVANTTLGQSSLVSGENGRFTVLGGDQSTLDGVSANRAIFVGDSTASGNLRIVNDLNLTHTRGDVWLQGRAGTAVLEGGGTITGTRSGNSRSEIVFDPDNTATATFKSSGGALTLGVDVLVRTAGQGHNTLGDENELLINQGVIQATNSLQSLRITGNQWRNEGSLIQTGGGTLNLDGTFRTVDLGQWTSETARIQILGQLDNTGATLDFSKDGGTGVGGAMTLKTGAITGGIIAAPSSSDPFRTNPGNTGDGFLDGVTLDGFTSISIGNVVVSNGLHLQNTLTGNSELEFFSSFAGTPPKLTFEGTQNISGNGEISFNSVQTGELRISGATGPATLTIENGITVTTDLRDGIVGSLGHNLTNQGEMIAKRSPTGIGRSLTIEANQLRNEGLMSVTRDAAINITAADFVNTGTLGIYGGAFSSTANVENSGLIEGLAFLDASVVNEGVIAPGFSPGLLTIDNLNQTGLGSLEMELGGLLRGDEYDAIDIINHLSLAGTLDIILINGFEPGEDDSFDLLNWDTASFGPYNFDFSGAMLAPGLAWDTSSFEIDGAISVSAAVPEPSTGAAAALAVSGVMYLRRRGKHRRARQRV